MTPDLDTIVNLAKKRGFVFQSSEIYGGLRSAYDYGPLGVELLNNVKAEWTLYQNGEPQEPGVFDLKRGN